MTDVGFAFRTTTSNLAKFVTFDARDNLSFATAAARGMDPFVPFDTGKLAGSATPKVGAVSYPLEYASYPYEGHGRIHKDHHMRATSHWDKAYSASGMRELREEVLHAVKSKH